MAKRFHLLGMVSLVLAILELAYGVWKLVGAALMGVLVEAERALLGSLGVVTSLPVTGMLAAVETFSRKIAVIDAARAVPMMIASGFLIPIALRIKSGDRAALLAARTWVWCALGTVALSGLLQLVITVPATLDYQREIMKMMPTVPTSGPGAAPFDFKRMTDTWMLASTVIGVMMGTAFLATWPIVLRVWADRVLKQSEPPPGSAFGG